MRFQSTLATFELQNYVVMEQFAAENIPLVSGRFVFISFHQNKEHCSLFDTIFIGFPNLEEN